MLRTLKFVLLMLLALILIGGSVLTEDTSTNTTLDPISQETPRYYIIYIADDLPYNSIGPYAVDILKVFTPAIDKMAEKSVKFLNAYGGAICGIARAAIYTGLNPQRFGFQILCNVGTTVPRGLPNWVPTIFDYLSELRGVTTGLSGKWHLGYDIITHFPLNYGIQKYVGPFIQRAVRRKWNPLLFVGNQRLQFYGNSSRIYTAEGIKMYQDAVASGQSMILFVTDSAPHVPYSNDPEWISIVDDATDYQYHDNPEALGLFADIYGIDRNVDDWMKAISASGVESQTVFILTSDNGASTKLIDVIPNGYLNGWKSQAYEGSFKVPFLVYAPGMFQPGEVVSRISFQDLLPTILDIEGVDPSEYFTDGTSFLPSLQGECQPSQPLFMSYGTGYTGKINRYSEWGAFFESDNSDPCNPYTWKYVFGERKDMLFNLNDDPYERNNLFDDPRYHDLAQRLKNSYLDSRLYYFEVGNQNEWLPDYSNINDLMNISSWPMTFCSDFRIEVLSPTFGQRIIFRSANGNFKLIVTEDGKIKVVVKEILPDGTKHKIKAKSLPQLIGLGKWYSACVSIGPTPLHRSINGPIKLYVNGQLVGKARRNHDIDTSTGFIYGSPGVTVINEKTYNTYLRRSEVKRFQDRSTLLPLQSLPLPPNNFGSDDS